MSVDPPDLFSPHTRSRSGDPDTSHAAADYAAPKMNERRIVVLQHFVRFGSMTDLDLQILCKDQGSTYRTRRSELAQMGLVVDTGVRRLQQDTNRIIWAITPRGRAVALALAKGLIQTAV